MYSVFAILIIITSILLVFVVLVQNPKGGGLSSTFGGGSSNQIMGAKKTTDFLEKTTWTLAIVLISLTMLSNFAITRNIDSTNEIKSQEQIDKANSQVANVQGIKKFVLLENEWTDSSGELTPTLKLKRSVIAEMYNDEIESMYEGIE